MTRGTPEQRINDRVAAIELCAVHFKNSGEVQMLRNIKGLADEAARIAQGHNPGNSAMNWHLNWRKRVYRF